MMLSVMYMIILETVRHVTITYNLGDLADWVSAIGTISAVILSLYLASKRNRPKLSFDIDRDGFAFVYNKSFNPVELIEKGKKEVLPLEPLDRSIKNLRSNNPFNNEVCGVHYDQTKKINKLKYTDIISGSHYKVIVYLKNDIWHIKQYRIFANRFLII